MFLVAPLRRRIADEDRSRKARVEKRLAVSPGLAEPLRRLGYDSRELWAWRNYRACVEAFVRQLRREGADSGARVRLLEVGGGRSPLWTAAAAEALGADLTVNDIDARELSLAPPDLAKAQFDVAAEAPAALAGTFDLIVSHMVMEHVADARRAWANMYALLAPGGVAMAFHPTLYAPPFVFNWLVSDRLTAPVLRLLDSRRHEGEAPKFPARYDLCFASPERVEPALRRCGYREVLIAPFWGDRYLRRLPPAQALTDAFTSLAEARDWRSVASYAFTIARR